MTTTTTITRARFSHTFAVAEAHPSALAQFAEEPLLSFVVGASRAHPASALHVRILWSEPPDGVDILEKARHGMPSEPGGTRRNFRPQPPVTASLYLNFAISRYWHQDPRSPIFLNCLLTTTIHCHHHVLHPPTTARRGKIKKDSVRRPPSTTTATAAVEL